MYDPVPARPSKTGIRRSKSGCAACRQKRRKCDESKPSCSRCNDAGVRCSYPTTVEFRDSTGWAAQKVKRRVYRGLNEREPKQPSTPLQRERAEAPSARFQLSPPSECDMANGNNVLASGEHITGTVPEPRTTSPNNSEERSEGDQAEESRDSDHPSESLSGRGQAVQPVALSSSDEPVLGITPPCTDLDFASWMPTGAISPSWNDCMAAEILTGDPLPDSLDQVALDMDLGPSYNGVWQYLVNSPGAGPDLASSRFPVSMVDCATVTPQNNNSNSSSSPLAVGLDLVPTESASTTSKASDGASPATAVTRTSSSSAQSYEQNIWVAPLPSRIPALPVRDRVYLAHFTSEVIHMMPGRVKYLREMAMESEPIRACANALAAASLANRGGKFSNDGRGHWIAMQPHYSRALSFASQSMTMIQRGSDILLGCRVVMLILLLCFQLEMGCFGEIYRVLSMLDATILNSKNGLLSLTYGHSLAQCWLGLRALCEGTLRPHGLYGRESKTEPMVTELEDLTTTTSERFSSIATKAGRLGRRILLCRCMGGNERTTASALNKLDEWWSVIKSEQADEVYGTGHSSGSLLTEEDLYSELGRLRETLDVSEVPPGLPLNFDPAVPVPFEAIPEPLYLPNHQQAMELAAYSFAHISCDENHLRTLGSPTFKQNESRSPWLHLLLRVAAGLDPAECSRRNMYRQGICHYLHCAVLVLQDLAAIHFLDGLYQRMMDAGGYYEDCFTPLSLSSLGNKLLCRELTRGRTVFLLCPTYGTWTTRDILFSKGHEESFMIFGREADGRYFNDLTSLDDLDLNS